MGKLDDSKLLQITPSSPADRISLGKFELKYGQDQGSNDQRADLQRDISKLGKLELNYQSPLAPKITIGPDKIELNPKPLTSSTTETSTTPPAGPTVEQQRQALEATRKQLSPKTWEEFTRTWGSKNIEEYKKAVSEYAAKVNEFTKNAGEKAALGLELKITSGEMGFKTRLLAAAKTDGVENAVIARKLLATGLQVAAVTSLTSALPLSDRHKVAHAFATLNTERKDHEALNALLVGEPKSVALASPTTPSKKKKKHFGEPEITITVEPAGKSKVAKG